MKSIYIEALADIADIWRRAAAWRALARVDLRDRYHRSRLGLLWAGLSILLFVGVVSPIFSELLGVPLEVYSLHLLLGLILWNFISTVLIDSTRAFTDGRELVSSYGISYASLIARVVWRNLLIVGYQMVVFVIITLLLFNTPNLAWLWVLPGLVLVVCITYCTALIVAVIATRFGDFAELLNNLLRLVFFATPIMWLPEQKSALAWVVELNPIHYMVQMVRAPLMSQAVEPDIWWRGLVILLVMAFIAAAVFAKNRAKIAFWL